MTMLATGTPLGELELSDVYFTYDFPRIFTCRTRDSGDGRMYLVSFVDDTDSGNLWLYLHVSKERFDAIRSGKIDLHDAFSKAKGGTLFEVETRYALNAGMAGCRDDRVRSISAENLTEEVLSAPGALLIDAPNRHDDQFAPTQRDQAEIRVAA